MMANSGRRSWIFCCILASLIIQDCSFHPDSDLNFNLISSEVSIPPIQIDLNQANDTINVPHSIEFKYAITGIDPNRQYSVVYFTDELIKYGIDQPIGKFVYSPPSNMTGYLPLTIQVSLTTGTGSLAEKLGAERIVYERSWIMSIETNFPDQPVISSIKPTNGSLKVEWTKYKKINFKAYHIIVRNKSYATYTITNPDSAFFFDQFYLGGESSYQIVTETLNGLSATSIIKSINDEVPSFKKYEVLTEKVKFYFSASRYPANARNYEVYESDSPGSPGIKIFSTTNPIDTVFDRISFFGKPRFIYVTTTGKIAPNESYPKTITSLTSEFLVGQKIEEFNTILFAQNHNRFFTVKENMLKAFLITTNELQGSILLPNLNNPLLHLSPDQNNIIGLFNNKLIFWDVLTLSVVKEIDFSLIIENQSQYIVGVGFMNNGNLLLSRVENSIGNGRLLVYEPGAQTIVSEYTGLVLPWGYLELSDNEVYVLAGNIIVKIGNSTFTMAFAVDYESPLFFNPNNQNRAFYGNIYPLTNGSILNRDIEMTQDIEYIYTPPISIYEMDIVGSYVGGRRENSNNYVVYDYKNQKIVWEGEVENYYTTVLNGSYMYSNRGVRLKLQK